MGNGPNDHGDRARAWRHAKHAEACETIRRWEHGTTVRSSRYPDYWDYNTVRVEQEPQIGAARLSEIADRELDGLTHRRLDFELVAPAERLRADFEALGWRTDSLVWMRHDGRTPPQSAATAVEVAYDDVLHLREEWHREDFPELDTTHYVKQARELALRRRARVLAVLDAGVPVAFSQVTRDGAGAEVTHVFVQRARRGAGLGTAVTVAALRLARGAPDTWITADYEDRPKDLYARLGFRAVWREIQFTRELAP